MLDKADDANRQHVNKEYDDKGATMPRSRATNVRSKNEHTATPNTSVYPNMTPNLKSGTAMIAS